MTHVRQFFCAGLVTVVAAALIPSGVAPASAATPVVTVSVETNPVSRPEPGGTFTYTVRVTNTGIEAVRITALNDSATAI